MNNRNLTIIFVKGNRTDIIKQLKDITKYCFDNNLFIEDIIITSKADYTKSLFRLLSYIKPREKLTHLVAISKDLLIKNDDIENIFDDLASEGKIKLHFVFNH